MYHRQNYKKISDFYKEDDNINSKCVGYYTRRKDDVVNPRNINEQYTYIVKPNINTPVKPIHTCSKPMMAHTPIKPITHTCNKPNTNSIEHFTQLTWEAKKYENVSLPNVWGSAYWFMLHAGSYSYDPSEGIDYMKNFILGIPVMIPCISCRVHARNYINSKMNELDSICANRDMLFKFFVDFHNAVNKRLHKVEMSLEDAYKLYSGKAEIKSLSYK